MVEFSEKQRIVLHTAWKLGHLNNSKNYGTISEVTGLSRKQISNWARSRINRFGRKPIARKSSSQLISIYYELPEKMRTLKDYHALLVPQLASELRGKMEKHDVMRNKSRFTSQQRKVLMIVWKNGFLCDRKNYASLSQITGLTRKQISNWARTKIHKCKGNLPQKNSGPLISIFKELSSTLQTVSNVPQPQRVEYINVAPRQFEWQHQHVKKEVTSWESPLLYSSPIPPSMIPNHTQKVVAKEPKLHDLNTNGHWSSLSYGLYKDTVNGVTDRNMKPNFALLPTEIKNWILEHKFTEIKEVDDKELEALSAILCITHDNIIHYLLQQGWYPTAADMGMKYVRTESTSV